MDESRAACAAARAMNEESRKETDRARAKLGLEPLLRAIDNQRLVKGPLARVGADFMARVGVAPCEVLEFVRRRRLARRGIGWVDAHLLASALTSSAVLWSVDADLSAMAGELGIRWLS